VTLYHGAEAAVAAESRFDAIFRPGGQLDDAPPFELPSGDPVHMPALLTAAGLAPSTSAARRLIDEGAVRVDGTPVEVKRYDVGSAELAGRVLAVGKRRGVRLVPRAGS